MTCDNCPLSGPCWRRGHDMVPRLRELCATRADYGSLLDLRFGVVDETVVPNPPMAVVPESPTMLQKAKRVGKAAVKFAADKGRLASKKVVAERRELCGACDHLADGRCDVCSCFIKVKTTLPLEECPIGKWGIEERPTAQAKGCKSCG